MRVVAPALCVALLVSGVAGCAAMPMTPAESIGAEVRAFEHSLEQLPGVDDVTLASGSNGAQVHVTVELDDDATTAEIQEAGVRAGSLRQEFPDGVYPGQIELRLDTSSYNYFTLPTPEALRGQLGYWAELTQTRVAGVTFRTFTAPVSVPPADAPMPASTTGAPVLLNAPTGRYIGITMLSGDHELTRHALEAIRAIDDPGASVGEWHIVSEDARVKAEFAGPALPVAGDVDSAIELLECVEELGPDATIGLRVDRTGDRPAFSAQLTAFDDELEDANRETIQDELRETPIWDALLALIETLDETGVDFSMSLLSNSLPDTGNFMLGVSVTECDFVGDDAWPTLSADLVDHWREVHDERLPGACPA